MERVFGDGNGLGDAGVGFSSLITNDEEDQTVTISRNELDNIQYHVQLLQNAHAASEVKVRDQEGLIRELVTFNHHIHITVEDLNARMRNVESASTFGDQRNRYDEPHSAPVVRPSHGYRSLADGRSRSPSPDAQGHRDRDERKSELYSTKKGRKNLQINIPGKLYVPPGAGLPTPNTSFTAPKSARTPKTPLTPGRIGPPSGSKKSSTCINKRGIHNLDKMVPPAYAQLPLLPLTDTEIIVYFFNSLARPIVSLRLYAREWGPALICDVLNSHRIIEPEYLRNTCSVKCTTAIKLGRRKYGEDWEGVNRALLKDVADDRATDMIRLAPDELPYEQDFDIRALCNGLRKHPDENDGGIFTHCVKWCQQNNTAYKLSNVWELASDLDAERIPRRFSSSSSSSSQLLLDGLAKPKQEPDMEIDGDAQSELSGDSVLGKNAEPSFQESLEHN